MSEAEHVERRGERRQFLRWPDDEALTFYAVASTDGRGSWSPFVREFSGAMTVAATKYRKHGGVWEVTAYEYNAEADDSQFKGRVGRFPPTVTRPKG